MSYTRGYLVRGDNILIDNATVGDGSSPAAKNLTSADTDWTGAIGKMVDIGDQEGMQEIRIYTDSAIANTVLASAKNLRITLECYSADTKASATSPFITATSGADARIPAADARLSLFEKIAGATAIAYAAGDLLGSIVIPKGMLKGSSYILLRVYTDAAMTTHKITAFVRTI